MAEKINGIKIRSSYCIKDRPTYSQWVRKMGISEIVYIHHPDAKNKAKDISKSYGQYIDTRSFWEKTSENISI
jgi:hypothetical protein